MAYRIGLDVGSTTAKMVVIDASGNVVWSRYERHNAHVKELIATYLSELKPIIGNSPVGVKVTGSVGMAVADMLGADFVQEVVAASIYTRRLHSDVKTLIDIGGEDSKIILLENGQTDLRMNGNCAGGTGAFIDQMTALLGVTEERLNELALNSTQLHPMAARCGVFAKTDVQNLISRNIPHEDIAASIFHAIAVQTITTLAHGSTLHAPILLCGGPLTFLSALRKAFSDYMRMSSEDYRVTSQSMLIPAIGSALAIEEVDADQVLTIEEISRRLASPMKVTLTRSLPRLFKNERELTNWRAKKSGFSVQIVPMRSHENVVVGIDSGSTTTKVIVTRLNGDIIFTDYTQSRGNPVKAAVSSLELLKRRAAAANCELNVVGSCSTGYGEELIKTALGLDHGIIETMAHYRAAQRLMPDVSFILDIGGQDVKAIFVENGVVTRMELNEACSSGCGTFLQTFAESLGHSVGDFASMACTAKRPCDLGSRCTVFMNSKIKQVLREGASVEDIAAGLSYSVVNNCLYKVLKLRDVKELGTNIVVQGGTMRNDAVVRALELMTGCEVARSSMPEMMGAYGCVLYSAQQYRKKPSPEGHTIDDLIESAANYKTDTLHCKGCENQCQVTRYKFAGKRNYYSGNKCERVFSSSGFHVEKGLNIYTEKYRLLFDRKQDAHLSPAMRPLKLGIPRVLNFYENYPFWHALFAACGIETILSSPSKMESYENALCSVMSDNICFPAKLVHSHIAELSEREDVDRIFMPYVIYEIKESPMSTNSYNCPIVSGYSDVIRSAMTTAVPVDSPVINFGNRKHLKKQIKEYLATLKICGGTAENALVEALRAQDEYQHAMRRKAEEILAKAREDGKLVILLAGRPYHTDPLVQHELGEMIAGMGVHVISEDIVRGIDHEDGMTNSVRQWTYINRIIKAAWWAAQQDSSVQFVEMTSFGCGPDSFVQDEVRDLLTRKGKALTLLKIDDLMNMGSLKLRVRSLIESLQQVGANEKCHREQPFRTTRVFKREDSGRTILMPFISEYISPLIESLGPLAGYTIKLLPPSDAESAAIGLKYANNEVCYPATLIVGDIIKALQSSKYDVKNLAVGMSQTGGQCRATNYAGLIKRAMVQAGFADVPLITLGVTTMGTENAQEFDFPWKRMAPVVLSTLLYADAIAKMHYACVVRETEAGISARLRDKYLKLGGELIESGKGTRLDRLVSSAAVEFEAATRTVDMPCVGIVGEIFLKFNHYAHQSLIDQIIGRGVEVLPPLITNFFLQEFVNIRTNKRMGLTDSKTPNVLLSLLYRLTEKKIRKFNKAGAAFRYFRPFTDIRKGAELSHGIVSPAAQFGEGWLLPAEIVEMAEAGVTHVVSCQPFGCIANHVVAKGVERVLKRRYPQLSLLMLDFDGGVSEVNVTNRLLLFLNDIVRRAS